MTQDVQKDAISMRKQKPPVRQHVLGWVSDASVAIHHFPLIVWRDGSDKWWGGLPGNYLDLRRLKWKITHWRPIACLQAGALPRVAESHPAGEVAEDGDLVKILEDAKGREWITGRDPDDTTICIRITESDRKRLLAALIHPVGEATKRASTFVQYDGLPEPLRNALIELETFIGDCDGKDTVIATDEHTCIDDGTIDAEDAVKAFNTIVAALTSCPAPAAEVAEVAEERVSHDRALEAAQRLIHAYPVDTQHPNDPLDVDEARNAG